MSDECFDDSDDFTGGLVVGDNFAVFIGGPNSSANELLFRISSGFKDSYHIHKNK